MCLLSPVIFIKSAPVTPELSTGTVFLFPATRQLVSKGGDLFMLYPSKSPSVHVIGKNKSDSILGLFL